MTEYIGPAAEARYTIPVRDDGLGWTRPGFNDGAWARGPLALGYENDPADYARLINTTVRPQSANGAATTVRARLRFDVDAAPASLFLRVRHDDGFVAWLNGAEVARRNVGPSLGWDAEAIDHPDDQAIRFEDIALDPDALQQGENVLAVLVINTVAGSSDLLLDVRLTDALGGDGPLPAAQDPDAIDLAIDAVVAAPDPAESYVVVHNRSGAAVDLSGWILRGRGVRHVLRAGTVLPADGRVYVVADAPSFRARAGGPSGGQGLFVQGNWVGALLPDGEMALVGP